MNSLSTLFTVVHMPFKTKPSLAERFNVNQPLSEQNGQKQHSPSRALQKAIGVTLAIASFSLFSLWLLIDFLPFIESFPHQKQIKRVDTISKSPFQVLWEQDIKEMFAEKVFPQEISSIGKIRVFMLDQNLHSQFQKISAPFKQKRDGQNLLEVSFMSHRSDDDNSQKLIIQYNLTDKDSGNMFWEHSRVLTVSNSMLEN